MVFAWKFLLFSRNAPGARRLGCFLAVLVFLSALGTLHGGSLLAQDRGRDRDQRPSTGEEEWIPLPTLGGKQFWADEFYFHDWRIQRNAMTGHCRLLDGNAFRHTSGTFNECRNKLAEIRKKKKLPPMRGRAVLVLHGLICTHTRMEKLVQAIRDETDYLVFNVEYPSTRGSIAEHAQMLDKIIQSLKGIEEISFVAHSLGNIIIRRYLYDYQQTHDGQIDPRLRRMVMIAPPNHGSLMALAASKNDLLAMVNGRPLQELGPEWTTTEKKLVIPPLEFGIIAGGRDDQRGFNPFLPGNDDGTVSIESARLPGAADFMVIPELHTFIMKDPMVIRCTTRFLKRGYFTTPEGRQPIPREDAPPNGLDANTKGESQR